MTNETIACIALLAQAIHANSQSRSQSEQIRSACESPKWGIFANIIKSPFNSLAKNFGYKFNRLTDFPYMGRNSHWPMMALFMWGGAPLNIRNGTDAR